MKNLIRKYSIRKFRFGIASALIGISVASIAMQYDYVEASEVNMDSIDSKSLQSNLNSEILQDGSDSELSEIITDVSSSQSFDANSEHQDGSINQSNLENEIEEPVLYRTASPSLVTATEREQEVTWEINSAKDSLNGKEIYQRPTIGTEDDSYAKSIGEQSGWAIIDEMREFHIVDQSSVDRLINLSRNDLTKVVLLFENTDKVTFPEGVYYVKDSNWWLVEGTGGDIDLTGSTFVLDQVNHEGYSMSIRATGDQLGRMVTGGTFIGSVETNKVDISTPGKVSVDQTSGYLYNSLIKTKNLIFDGQTYVNAVQLGSHAYDLNGVDNVTITRNTFAGYGGKEFWSEQELAHITPILGGAMTSNHLLYSEAVQIDMAEAVASGLADFKNDLQRIQVDAWPSHSNLFGFVEKSETGQYSLKENLFDGTFSKNVNIKDNYFIGYNGPSAKSFVHGTNETIKRPYSQSVGSHSVERSSVDNYSGIVITGNHFKDTLSPVIASIPRKHEAILFYPIHLMGNIQTVAAHEAMALVENNYFDSNIWQQFEDANPGHNLFFGSGEADQTYIGWFKGDEIISKPETATKFIPITNGVEERKVTLIDGIETDNVLVKTYTNEYKEESYTLPSEIQNDATMLKGTRRVDRAGASGIKATGVIYTVSVDGQLVTERFNDKVIKEAVAELIVIGTREAKQNTEVLLIQLPSGVEEYEVTKIEGVETERKLLNTYSNSEDTVIIEFVTEYKEDKQLDYANRTVKQEGGNGYQKSGVTYTVKNNQLLITPINERKEPITKIITVGTKPSVTKESIGYTTDYVEDKTADAGIQTVSTAGVLGTKEITVTYILDTSTGEVTAQEPIVKVIAEPKSEVVTVGTKPSVTEESLEFSKQYVEDNTLPAAVQTVTTAGVAGTKEMTVTYVLDTSTGEVTAQEPTEKVVLEPKSEIVTVGTKPSIKAIDFETNYQLDDTLKSGETKILVVGQEGSITTPYILDEKTGVVVEDKENTETVSPINQIIAISFEDALKEEIPYGIDYEDDAEFEPGYTEVIKQGVPGGKYYIIVDGKEVILSEIQPENEVVKRGTGFHQHGEGEQADPKPEAEIKVEVLPFTTRRVEDPTLPLGQEIVEQEGQDGRRTYVVTPDGEVDLEFTPAVERVLRVGTKIEEPTKEETEDPTKEGTEEPTVEEPTSEDKQVFAGGAAMSVGTQGSVVTQQLSTASTYSRVARAQAEKSLPNTGDAASILGMIGLGLTSFGLVGQMRRKK